MGYRALGLRSVKIKNLKVLQQQDEEEAANSRSKLDSTIDFEKRKAQIALEVEDLKQKLKMSELEQQQYSGAKSLREKWRIRLQELETMQLKRDFSQFLESTSSANKSDKAGEDPVMSDFQKFCKAWRISTLLENWQFMAFAFTPLIMCSMAMKTENHTMNMFEVVVPTVLAGLTVLCEIICLINSESCEEINTAYKLLYTSKKQKQQ